MQHTYCTPITWDEAIPEDLVFYPEDTHIGIVCGFDSGGNIQIIHCASGVKTRCACMPRRILHTKESRRTLSFGFFV